MRCAQFRKTDSNRKVIVFISVLFFFFLFFITSPIDVYACVYVMEKKGNAWDIHINHSWMHTDIHFSTVPISLKWPLQAACHTYIFVYARIYIPDIDGWSFYVCLFLIFFCFFAGKSKWKYWRRRSNFEWNKPDTEMLIEKCILVRQNTEHSSVCMEKKCVK